MDNLLNRIHFADCLDVLRQIPDGSVDLMLTDPPYNTTQNKWEYQIDFEALKIEWQRILKHDGAMVFTSQQPFTTKLISSMPEIFRYSLVWEKSRAGGFLNASRMPLIQHEDVLVFYRALPTFNPQKRKGAAFKKKAVKNGDGDNYGKFERTGKTTINLGDRFPTSIISFDNPNNDNCHPTQKPTDLFRYLIRTYSNPGDVVFDGYGGSGTTAIAAQMENRKFIVCENHLPYFEASTARLANLVAAPYLFSDCG